MNWTVYQLRKNLLRNFRQIYFNQKNLRKSLLRKDNLRNAANIHWWYWKGKDEVVAQYALTGYAQPIGVSDYQLSKAIPENLKSALPSIEEVEEELSQLLDNKKDKK